MREYISMEELKTWLRKRKSLKSLIPYEDIMTYLDSRPPLRMRDDEPKKILVKYRSAELGSDFTYVIHEITFDTYEEFVDWLNWANDEDSIGYIIILSITEVPKDGLQSNKGSTQ